MQFVIDEDRVVGCRISKEVDCRYYVSQVVKIGKVN